MNYSWSTFLVSTRWRNRMGYRYCRNFCVGFPSYRTFFFLYEIGSRSRSKSTVCKRKRNKEDNGDIFDNKQPKLNGNGNSTYIALPMLAQTCFKVKVSWRKLRGGGENEKIHEIFNLEICRATRKCPLTQECFKMPTIWKIRREKSCNPHSLPVFYSCAAGCWTSESASFLCAIMKIEAILKEKHIDNPCRCSTCLLSGGNGSHYWWVERKSNTKTSALTLKCFAWKTLKLLCLPLHFYEKRKQGISENCEKKQDWSARELDYQT